MVHRIVWVLASELEFAAFQLLDDVLLHGNAQLLRFRAEREVIAVELRI